MWRRHTKKVKKTWSLFSFSKWSKGDLGTDSGKRRLPRDLDQVLEEMTQQMLAAHALRQESSERWSPLGTGTEPNIISSFDKVTRPVDQGNNVT